MSRRVSDIFIVMAAAAVVYLGAAFIDYTLPKNEPPPVPPVRESPTLSEKAEIISRSINTISPTPPTSDSWTVERVDFVADESLAYVVYHDTRNIFRILVKIELASNRAKFKTLASFELKSAGPAEWTLAAGEDKAKGKLLTSYLYNPGEDAWTKTRSQ